jgi:hypothetical protein
MFAALTVVIVLAIADILGVADIPGVAYKVPSPPLPSSSGTK